MVKLAPDEQASFVAARPDAFQPGLRRRGHRGCTYVRLRAASKRTVQKALVAAWRSRAPKRLTGP
jgi:hypothetical protein